VRSGDPDNCEAQAARAYWQVLFGLDFRRDLDAPGLNAALNYSYAVLRACVARGLVGAGLHPSFSLHHKNPQNPFNLVDDLVEPFRPIADLLLWEKYRGKIDALDIETKTGLSALTAISVPVGEDETSPFSLAAVRTCRSLAALYLGEGDKIALPALPTPLDVAAA
jgi:CRISPR-associated protein Cas1